MRSAFCALLVLFSTCACSFGWSTKEHILLTRLAARELLEDPQTPPAMKEWLKKAAPDLTDMEGTKKYFLEQRMGSFPRGADGLSFWAVMPDMNALTDGQGENAKKVEPFGVPERLLHHVDLEFFFPQDEQRIYADDLSHKPSLKDIPRDMSDPRWQRSGMLPFRVEQCFKSMVADMRAGKMLSALGQFPRDEHAQKWAGMLAHYAEDNTQPHHSTADYKSATYFKDKLRAPNVHADMEYRLADDELDDYMPLREEFWTLFTADLKEAKDPIESDDPWTATVEVSLSSYDALPMIGRAAAAAYTHDDAGWKFDADKFFHAKGNYHGAEMTVLQMKASQMAWAVKRVERLWRKGWDDAHTPAEPTSKP